MTTQSPQHPAAILLERREKRRSLIAWARHCGYEPAAHHRLIIEKLEAVASGLIKRLAIFLPPGSAKSTYSSVLFPPWFLAQRENASILCASHSASLATTFGKRCRNLIESNEKVLDFSLAKDSQAADDWGTSHGCVYFCAGVGGRIAGHRADLGLIDDPIGSIDDADSQLHRDKVWDWYEWSFLPRLKPNAAVVVISTRWHEDDLMGRIVARDGGKWEVIKVPMEAGTNDVLGRSPGDMLWPEYFNAEMVAEAKANPRKWQGAYQQEPTPETGDYFKKEWLIGYEPRNLPLALNIYCASDHACSTKQANNVDSNLLMPFGVDEGSNIWILPDIWWKVADTGETVKEMLAMMQRRQPLAWISESEHIVKSIGPFLQERKMEEGIYTYVHELSAGKDKAAKARSIQGKMQMGKVFFPKYCPWWPKAEHELLTFPVGVHDEFPDVLGCIGRFLAEKSVPRTKTVRKQTIDRTFGWLKESQRRHDYAFAATSNGM